MTIQACLFDLDGTLLDTLADIGSSANRVLESRGFPPHPLERYRQFIGEGVARLFQQALPPPAVTPEEIAGCVAGFHEVYGEHWNDTTCPYPGVCDLLDDLSQRGIQLAVLSNKPDDFTRLCVAEHFGHWQFAAVLGQQDGLPRKPDPAGARMIAERLAVPPEAVLYVGDTAVDMQTARAAGMPAVGVGWGFRSVDELRQAGAEWIIGRPGELLDILERAGGECRMPKSE